MEKNWLLFSPRFQISGSPALHEEDSQVLLAGPGSQQERGWPGPGAQLAAGRTADAGRVDPRQWLRHWILAAEGQPWGALGQIRKCWQHQY